MTIHYNDIMCDVETTGLNPVDNGMIQIAAVRFNLEERSIDTSSMFDRCLAVPPRRYWDEGTRQWWSQQKRAVLEDIYSRMEEPAVVMGEFAKWVGYNPPAEPTRFWAKPLSFDWPFMASYFSDLGIPNPFHFRYACDANSYIRGLARDPKVESFKVEFHGDAHNALYDVINQINMLFKASDHYETTR